MQSLSVRLLPLVLVIASCAGPPSAQEIVDRAIEAQGGDLLHHAEVRFGLRGRHYTAWRDGGLFRYERSYADTTGAVIHDVLSNDGLARDIDGVPVPLDSAAYRSAETGVNSTIYFALLPFPLNDPAVVKRYLGSTILDGEPYHEIGVTFGQEGGGRDYEDRFVYWFHAERGTMGYLAYYFHTDGGGSRFRKVVNERRVNGVLFSDHLNFRHADITMDTVQDFDSLYTAGVLEPVSEIILEDVEVSVLATGPAAD